MSEYAYQILKSPIYWFFIIIIIFMVIIYYFYYSKLIGWFGEYWVKKELKLLPKDEYIILNNIMLNLNNKTCQIDHIVISKYGIFVIETKQYNGYITGSKYDLKWIRHSKNKKYYYTNPIRQNYGHVKFICQLLDIEESKVFNIVCIPSKGKLKIKHDGELVRINNIVDKLLSFQEIIIDNTNDLVDFINKVNIKDKKIRKMHVNNLKNKFKDKEDLCPKCGSDLVVRSGRYGNFLGCSKYPKCKYTRKIDGVINE